MEKKKAISVRLHEILLKNQLAGTKNLIGRILTITDSVASDSVQRKALKDLVENTVWDLHHYQRKDIDYYMKNLANAIGEDSEWVKYNDKPAPAENDKPYNPLTV